MVTFDPELSRKVDIVEEQIDFSSARKQFLQGDGEKRGPAPQIYSAKPFARTRGGGDGGLPEAGDGHVTWSDEGLGGEFTCARAVMTMVHEEEEEEGERRRRVRRKKRRGGGEGGGSKRGKKRGGRRGGEEKEDEQEEEEEEGERR